MNNMIKRMGVTEMGKLMGDRRRAKRWTQEQLEDLCGVSQGMISRLERGQIQRPNLDFMREIAKSLETPYEDFVSALYGSVMAAGVLGNEEEIAALWSVTEIPPDVTTDELILLKHLFRAVRSYRDEVAGPRTETAARRVSRSRAADDGDQADQPALLPVEPQQVERG